MAILKRLTMAALIATIWFTACTPDDTLNPDTNTNHTQWIAMLGMGGNAGPGSLSCYEVVYPISFILPNGMLKEAENENQMIGLLNANPSPIQIVFPITLVDEQGNEIIVNDEDDLEMYLDLCENEDDWEDLFGDDDLFDCYEVLFPVDLEMSDGSIATVNDVNELIALFDEEPYPVSPVFPVTLIDEDGNQIMVNGLDDLDDLADDCDDDDNEWEPGDLECYDLGFPVEVLLEDGTTVFANDPAELAQILLGDPAPVDFVYPITLIDEDGNEILVDNPDDLADLIEDCEDGDDEDDFEWDNLLENECYELTYPLGVRLSDSSTTVVADEAELVILFDGDPYPINLVYPVTLVDDDGNSYTANNEDDLEDLLDDCDDDNEQCNHGLMTTFFLSVYEMNPNGGCYDIVYPFTLTLKNGTEVPLADQTELDDYLSVPGNFGQIECALFPFDLIEVDNGNTLTIGSAEDLHDAVDNCL